MADREVETVRTSGPLPALDLPRWEEEYGVVAGITLPGAPPVADLGLAGPAPVSDVLDRWRALLRHTGFQSVVVSRQVHGVQIGWHDAGEGIRLLDGLDGHATATPGVLLAVTVADCVPVYLFDTAGRRVALLHAGWRGTAMGILARGVERLQADGARVENIVMHCGVGICGGCYEVGAEVLNACGVQAGDGESSHHLDLRGVLSSQAAGLGIGRVSASSHCSAHDRALFHSHRASAGRAGRMAAYVGIRPRRD